MEGGSGRGSYAYVLNLDWWQGIQKKEYGATFLYHVEWRRKAEATSQFDRSTAAAAVAAKDEVDRGSRCGHRTSGRNPAN